MPLVELSWNPGELQKSGPIIRIKISAPGLETEEGRAVGLEFQAALEINALIDSGASVTVINPEVAASQRLRHTGFASIAAAGSSGRYNEHAAAIEFPDTTLKRCDPIRVVACPIVRQPVSCLIGRDILRKWLLTYDGRSGRIRIED